MNYLLTNKGSYTSARMLASNLGLKVTSTPDVIKNNNGRLLLRYGNSLPVYNDEENIHNSINSIKTVADSVSFSKFCTDNNIKTAVYTRADLINIEDLVFPVLLRNKYHSRGRDIIYVKDINQLKEQNLFQRFIVPFIQTDSEIGIHVVNGQVVKIFKKVPLDNAHPFIRNLDNNYHFKIIDNIDDNFKLIQDIVLHIFNLLGLTFGRADVGYTRGKNDYVIWEINSAPGLNNKTASIYANKLADLLDI
jgi:glutathione synthase/RimK-type ligase-like ATP-grasp enzyme